MEYGGGDRNPTAGSTRRPLYNLEALWARPAWIAHLVLLEKITSLVIWLTNISYDVIEEKGTFEVSWVLQAEDTDVQMVLRWDGRGSALPSLLQQKLQVGLKAAIESWSLISRANQSMMKIDGLVWGCSTYLVASQTPIFAKSYVKLVSKTGEYQKQFNREKNEISQ
ncbi:hypothetical protein PtB15_18B417 [Puccinia triticina]|nr:hypothetical protein PtB15_18B417 [Puccinia triticina]